MCQQMIPTCSVRGISIVPSQLGFETVASQVNFRIRITFQAFGVRVGSRFQKIKKNTCYHFHL